MKQRGDQTEIMLPRPCVITPAFNYVDIWLGRASIPQKRTKSYQTSVSYHTYKCISSKESSLRGDTSSFILKLFIVPISITLIYNQNLQVFKICTGLPSCQGENTIQTLKRSTGSVDSVFNPSMLLCTAGGRENLRTDRELRPSLGEIGKAT